VIHSPLRLFTKLSGGKFGSLQSNITFIVNFPNSNSDIIRYTYSGASWIFDRLMLMNNGSLLLIISNGFEF